MVLSHWEAVSIPHLSLIRFMPRSARSTSEGGLDFNDKISRRTSLSVMGELRITISKLKN